ncbi:MAG: hypothetical protein H6810_10045 [Phycisphaeraceae bacterium]|nr:MAG: hypothetical protein H6810_10045 [Phycisphaeraceae bacterium]
MKRTVLIALAAAAFASPAFSQGPPADRGRPATDRPADRVTDRPPPEQIVGRLHDRLVQLDELRDRLAGIIARIDAGEAPEEALGPIGMRLMQRRAGEGPGGPGSPGPGLGPDGDPGGLWGLLREAPGVGMGPDGRPPADAPEIPVEQVRAFIQAHLPELASRIAEADGVEPGRGDRMVQRMTPRLADIIRAEKDDPGFVELRIDEMRTGMAILGKSRTLHQLIRSGGAEAEVDRAKQELRDLLGRQFDLRQKLEAHRLDRMQADLESARAELEVRAGDRDKVIDDHLSRVLDRTLGDDDAGFGRGPRGRDRGRDRDHD